MLIRIPKPVADDEFIERVSNPDGNSEICFVDPLSGIVIVVDESSGSRGRAVKRRRRSPLWRSLLSRWLAAAGAAGSAIIPLESDGALRPALSPANPRRLQAHRDRQNQR